MWKNFNKTDRRILTTASLLLLLMLYFLYDDSLLLPDDDSKNLIAIGKIEQIDQDVRRKITKQFSWKSARRRDTVHVGDSIFTGKDSSALIELQDGRKLTIQPNSLIVFHVKGNQLSLDLRFGRLAGNIDGCVKIKLKGMEKEVCGNNSSLEIDAEGEVKNQTEIAGKELISWVHLPPRPFFHSHNSTPLKVSWKAHRYFSRFHFQLSKQKDFETIFHQEKSKSSQIETLRYPREGEFYVRIQGDDIKGRPVGFSKIEKIEIKAVPLLTITHPTPQQVITFRTDADGELIDQNQFDLSWNYSLKNVSFEMEIARDENFTDIVSKSTALKNTVVTISDLPEGSYKARVRDATVVNGTPRPWSDSVSFSVDILDPTRLPGPNLLTQKIKHLAPSDKPVVVKWKKVIEADQYIVETSQNPKFTEKKTFQTKSPELNISELEPGKTYFRVYGATEKGTLGEPSRIGSLDVNLQQPVLSPVKSVDIMGKTPEDPGDPQVLQASWTDLKLATSYLVQVAEDSKFQKKVEFQTVEPSGQITLPKPGGYYWRVQGLGKNGEPLTDFSTPGYVNYNLRVPLSLPALQEPQDKMTLFFQKNIAPYVWFEWKPVRQAAQYQFEISRDPSFQTKLLSLTTKTPRFLMKEKLPEGLLYWRVQAQGNDTRISHWSPPRLMNIMSGRAPASRPPEKPRE